MLPSLPQIRQGSSDRPAAVISSPVSAINRTRFESKRNPGGKGIPKLTNSRPRVGALPLRSTSSSDGRFSETLKSLAKTALAARRDARLLLKKDLLVSLEPSIQRSIFCFSD